MRRRLRCKRLAVGLSIRFFNVMISTGQGPRFHTGLPRAVLCQGCTVPVLPESPRGDEKRYRDGLIAAMEAGRIDAVIFQRGALRAARLCEDLI
jgi:hypothetical protein